MSRPVSPEMFSRLSRHSTAKDSSMPWRRSSSSMSKPYASCAVKIDTRVASSGESLGSSTTNPPRGGVSSTSKAASFPGSIRVMALSASSEIWSSAMSRRRSVATLPSGVVIPSIVPGARATGRGPSRGPLPAPLELTGVRKSVATERPPSRLRGGCHDGVMSSEAVIAERLCAYPTLGSMNHVRTIQPGQVLWLTPNPDTPWVPYFTPMTRLLGFNRFRTSRQSSLQAGQLMLVMWTPCRRSGTTPSRACS